MNKIQPPKKSYRKMEYIFVVLIILLVALFVPFAYECYTFRQQAIANMPTGMEFPMLSDFKLTIKASFVYGFIELIFRYFLPPFLEKYCKIQNDPVQRKLRSTKMASQIYRVITYSIATSYGYQALKDTNFLTSWLGGKTSGDFINFLDGYPYYQMSPLMKNYCLITMAYHLGSCYPMLYSEKKSDFLEMSLHHFSTLFSFFGLYLINVPGILCLVNWLHDLADITVSISRMLGETRHPNLTAGVFSFNIMIWTYTRLLIFPMITYRIFTYGQIKAPNANPKFIYLFCFLNSCLILLHAYWLRSFFSIIFKYRKDGVTEDIIQDLSKNGNKTKKKNL